MSCECITIKTGSSDCECVKIESSPIDEVLTVGVVGPQGPQGPAGAAGVGVPSGGISGYVLTKASNTDYDTEWVENTTGVPPHAPTHQDGASDSIQPFSGVRLDLAAPSAPAVGRIVWNDEDGTADMLLKGGNVNMRIGQSSIHRVYNNSGAAIPKGKVVYIFGSQGQRTTIRLADNDSDTTSARTFGFTAEAIADNESGFVISEGILNNVNTNGFADGTMLWLGDDGNYVGTRPTQPEHGVFLGVVVKGNSGGAGSIFVKVQNGQELDELHDVLITTPTAGQVLFRNSLNTLWVNHTLDKNDVGLSEVDNTSDLDKPISNATQDALDLKADLVTVTDEEIISIIDDVGSNNPALYGLKFYKSRRYIETYAVWRSEYTNLSPTGYFYIYSSSGMQSYQMTPFKPTASSVSFPILPCWFGTLPSGVDDPPTGIFAPYGLNPVGYQDDINLADANSGRKLIDHTLAAHNFAGRDEILPSDIEAAPLVSEAYTINASFPSTWQPPDCQSYYATFTFTSNVAVTVSDGISPTVGARRTYVVFGGSTGGTFANVIIAAGQTRIFERYLSTNGWQSLNLFGSDTISFGSGGSHNPVANQSYFVSDLRDLAPTISSTSRQFRFPSGTLQSLYLNIAIGGTLGSLEAGRAAIFNITTNSVVGVLPLGGNIFFTNQFSQYIIPINSNSQPNAGLINTNHNYAVRITMPATMTTLPTTVRYYGFIPISRTEL